MSKSIPNSAVFLLDSPEEIRKKMKKAFCPEKETGFNPVLDWTKHLLFVDDKFVLNIERPEKFGGNVSYDSYQKLETDYKKGKLHPMDLKTAVGEALVKKLEPARKHFSKPKLKKIVEKMKSLTITR